ncbi:MAG: hypothetical protein IPL26_20970 [Leptospiraceae bacterium]|nr:hypothetical protein [Leptospiraceae bacterium]
MSIILIGYNIVNCTSLVVKPGVHERVKKIALISIHSPRLIDTRVSGVDYLLGFNNDWGKEALDKATEPMIDRIKKGTKFDIIPIEEVVKSETYKKLPILETKTVATVASIGLLPIATALGNDKQLGKLAEELNVDGVMIIGVEPYPTLDKSWLIYTTCLVRMKFIIVEKDGTRGYYHLETFEPESTLKYDPITKMVDGLMIGTDAFIKNWVTKKIY